MKPTILVHPFHTEPGRLRVQPSPTLIFEGRTSPQTNGGPCKSLKPIPRHPDRARLGTQVKASECGTKLQVRDSERAFSRAGPSLLWLRFGPQSVCLLFSCGRNFDRTGRNPTVTPPGSALNNPHGVVAIKDNRHSTTPAFS